ncbi:M [Farmington virus]|uniref:M n=1 Tax=Farmington virus TaxID=1027468 RepID=UPI000387ABD6|nr:M [Farmington virus] [Farmington virus]AGN91189.1 M [Farmington virus] [Farmington virus]
MRRFFLGESSAPARDWESERPPPYAVEVPQSHGIRVTGYFQCNERPKSKKTLHSFAVKLCDAIKPVRADAPSLKIAIWTALDLAFVKPPNGTVTIDAAVKATPLIGNTQYTVGDEIFQMLGRRGGLIVIRNLPHDYPRTLIEFASPEP